MARADSLAGYREQFESLARDQGLDFHPVDFELVPESFMMEVAVYGLPVRMAHWSFGVRYIHQYVQHKMGHSRIFEVIFPGNPNRAFLQQSNGLAENILVIAHVLGHADFSKHNALFVRMQDEAGYQIVDQAAARAERIDAAGREHGPEAVEKLLDAALALEQYIDISKSMHRPLYPKYTQDNAPGRPRSEFEARYRSLPGEKITEDGRECTRPAAIPPYPEADLLWFAAHYAPELEPWERDILLAVREESWYFYPLFACQIMNEGWASYWHARLLREADFVPHEHYLDAIRAHSDVVRPYAADQQVSLALNPYHLGFRIWEDIIEREGLQAAFRIRTEEDDFSFVRNFLTEELAEELGLFTFDWEGAPGRSQAVVGKRDVHRLCEAIVAPKFNYGAPRVAAVELAHDGSLLLQQDARTDGRGLDLKRARMVLEYLHRIWRRPVRLKTQDEEGKATVLQVQ